MKKHIRTIFALLLVAIVLSFSACVGSPETPIIKNKDIDKMLDDAENEEGIGMSELIENKESYKKSFTDEAFDVTVDVDASVTIPEVDKMSIIRVKQKPFTQEFLDKVKTALCGDAKLYDGSVLRDLTKKDLESEITLLEEEIELLNEQHPGEKQTDLENSLQEMRDRYNSAPDGPDVLGNPSDGRIHSVEEVYNRDKNNFYYKWLYEMNPDGEVFYGISDGQNGEYMSLSLNNSEDNSNLLSFRKNKRDYQDTSGLAPSNELDYYHWDGTEIPEEFAVAYEIMPEATVTLSSDDAVKQAEDCLKKLGLDAEFDMTACKIYTEYANIPCNVAAGEKAPCDCYYVIRYCRKINGAATIENGDSKYSEGWSGDIFSKQTWHQESIVFRINDNGIAGFDYVSPIEVMDTVVDSAVLKPFDEIKETFEKMVVMSNAAKDKHVDISIDSVQFGYTRISEKDNFDTGLLVPVWSFYGKNSNSMSFNKEDVGPIKENVMTINAVDATVIDKNLGY